jgi:GH15 family glucan-1,4-alpha-glucosidase
VTNLIEDYALIGNTSTAALVSRNGSIDWLCIPRFDSEACFCALLGSPENGRWLLTPDGQVLSSSRRYRGDSLLLETEYQTETGAVMVLDFMPITRRHERIDVVRIVRGLRGGMRMRMELILRFDYGRVIPWVTRTSQGIRAIAGPNAIELRTPVALEGRDFTTIAGFDVTADESIPIVLTWHASHKSGPRAGDPDQMRAETEAWWQQWSSRYRDDGEWREPVLRSLITLKALIYEPTGGIVAAPTTSLPEQLGGPRNWDYRYCWLRDSTLTLYALLISGYSEEARKWREWLLRAVAGHPQNTQIMYGLHGEQRLTEIELDWLSGYDNSRPVRIGNAAHAQLQLDVYGEVLDTLHVAAKLGLVAPTNDAWRLQTALMDFIESGWAQPDDGIWEVRGPRRNFTHSKVMAWVAVDRAIKAIERLHLSGPLERWRALRETIHRDVCERGFSSTQNAFVQAYGSTELDASLLMIPLVGFLPANDPRVTATVAAIRRELVVDGLVRRYSTETGVDGLPPGEGAFLACTFWLADNLALTGQYTEARRIFQGLLDLRNDVGLLAEQYDPRLKRQLGNFPQAFSHVSLVNTAHNLTHAHGPAAHRAENPNHKMRISRSVPSRKQTSGASEL